MPSELAATLRAAETAATTLASGTDAVPAWSAVSASAATALLAARGADLDALLATAGGLRDIGLERAGRPGVVTYSKKVFLPVTRLCRDRCHYCVFVDTPGSLAKQGIPEYMGVDEILEIARRGAELGCKEALFTLGDRPEDRWPAARRWLDAHGYESTLDYVGAMAEAVVRETGLVPHLNPGVMTWAEMQRLRPVAGSMGMMLETTATRLWSEPGGVHFGSPDKDPALRLRVLEDAGRSRIPFTTGVLLGIGETDDERAEALIAIRDLHERFGHVQETIVQNFRAKPRTAMQNDPDLELAPYIAAVATARLVLGPDATVQAPPNLTDEHELDLLLRAGVDDWGGVSPLTADHVNPERPWPDIDRLAELTARSGYALRERLTAHPQYLRDGDRWLDARIRPALEALQDPATHLADEGAQVRPAASVARMPSATAAAPGDPAGTPSITDAEAVRLLDATGVELELLAARADAARTALGLDAITFATNRNIDGALVGRTLDLRDVEEIVADAVRLGATEVCVQGLPAAHVPLVDVVRAIRRAGPDTTIHAFRPFELVEGAARAGLELAPFLDRLRDAGVTSTPGTGARLLEDDIRAFLSDGADPPAFEWVRTVEAIHRAGLRTTATMVYGHIERSEQIVRHLRIIARIQERTGGFREFIPMPFVPSDAPSSVRRRAGAGPTADRSRAVVAVSRLLLAGSIDHVQAAWTKLGLSATASALRGGADDIGGVLLDGRVRPEAGLERGLQLRPTDLDWIGAEAGRPLRERTTDYASIPAFV